MGDVRKLPKWAQEMIVELQQSQSQTGASVAGCHIENVGVKHSEHTAIAVAQLCDALSAGAEAVKANAKAVKEIAKSLSASGANIEFGNGIQLSDVRCK